MKGLTVLALHPCFDLVGGIVIDDLHGVFLGVTSTLLNLWFHKSHRRQPYFIGDKVHTLHSTYMAESPCVYYSHSPIRNIHIADT